MNKNERTHNTDKKHPVIIILYIECFPGKGVSSERHCIVFDSIAFALWLEPNMIYYKFGYCYDVLVTLPLLML